MRIVEIYFLKWEIKLVGIFVLVVGIFLFCYMLFYMVGIYRKIVGFLKVFCNVLVMIMWVGFVNLFCNLIVYGLRYLLFWKVFKKLCFLKLKGNRKRNYSYNFLSDWCD